MFLNKVGNILSKGITGMVLILFTSVAMAEGALLDPDVFDWQYYLVNNRALLPNNIDTETEAINHWQQTGFQQGLPGSPRFSVTEYLALNPDLPAYFSNNLVAAVRHYINHGRAAGRQAYSGQGLYGGELASLSTNGLVGDAVIGNPLMKIVTTSKFGGAVTELWYRNRNIVNQGGFGYGRLFQIAAWKNEAHRCNNAIEAGGRYSATTGGTATINHRLSAQPGEFNNKIIPSLFRTREDTVGACPGVPVHNLPQFGQKRAHWVHFEKKIKMNAGDDPHIIKFEVTLHTQEDLDHLIFQLYMALPEVFDQIRTIDLRTCAIGDSPSSSGCQPVLRTSEPAKRYSKHLIPIISDPSDGQRKLSFAMFTRESFQGQDSIYVASPRGLPSSPQRPDLNTTDTAVNFVSENVTQGSYTVPIYIVIGPRSVVTRKMKNIITGRKILD